ncbi:MAG: efflux RND transporter permease subunit, partial [Candidatus Omnitrophica bacterium]|nr:efflux RND transporter permease subunit [Candidatus Omnitrophota bacterium]
PSGRFHLAELEVSGRLDSEFSSPEEIANLVIPDMERATGKARQIYLKSLAEVKDTFAEVRGKSRSNRLDAVALIVQKQPASNTVEVARLVREEIARLQQSLPAGYELKVIVDTSPFIREAVEDVRFSLILGVILTGLVLFLFLHRLSSTLIVSLTIPMALVGTMFFMYLAGFTFNVISLSALALCTGIIIDCSIVVLENIYRHHQELKKDLIAAAEEGTAEVTPAVMASMLTNIVVFLPVVFTTGIVGQFFREFGLVQIFATLVAMATAFTLLPMLASRILASSVRSPWQEKWDEGFNQLRLGYRWLLDKALKHPGVTLAIALVLLVASFLLTPLIGTEFVPEPDQGISSINLRMPPGTNLKKTEEIVKTIEDRLTLLPECEHTFVSLGRISGGAMSAGSVGPEYASIIIKWKEQRRRSAQEILSEVKNFLAFIPAATLSVAETSSVVGRGATAPFMMYVTAPDWETLLPAAETLLSLLRKTSGVSDADISYHPGKPELNFLINRDRLAEFDLSPRTVALNCRAALEGLVATKFRQAGEEYDLRVTIPEKDRANRQVLLNLPVKNSLGDLYLLGQVASLKESRGPTVKERYNRQPSITLSAHVNKPLGEVGANFQRGVEKANLPPTVSLRSGTNIRAMKDAFVDLGTAILMATVLVYLVMAAQFESWKEPFVIMGSLPLAAIGILLSLFLLGKTINIFSLLGVIILIGIGVNNSILIIDFSKSLIASGQPPHQAIIQASATRLRPCLMTGLATAAGALPLALSTGKAATLRSPIGATVLGGVASSISLTLFVIPVIYSLMARKAKR